MSGGGVAEGGLPACERLSDDVISLPMHPYIDEPTQDRIIEALRGGRPLPIEWRVRMLQAGLVILLVLMSVVIVNDVLRPFPS